MDNDTKINKNRRVIMKDRSDSPYNIWSQEISKALNDIGYTVCSFNTEKITVSLENNGSKVPFHLFLPGKRFTPKNWSFLRYPYILSHI